MTNLQKGLVGHWTMDDADTSGGTLFDKSAYDRHAQFNGTVNTSQTSYLGEAYDFSDNGYLTAPSTIDPSQGTMSIVATPTTDADIQYAVAQTGYPTNGKGGIQEFGVDMGAPALFEYFSGDTRPSVSAGGSLNTEQHYIFTWENGNKLQAYRDGDLINEASISTLDMSNIENGTDLVISATTDESTTSRYFDGELSDIRVYDRVLSANEVRALYNMRSQRQIESDLQKGLVGHWTMDDADTSDGTVYDKTPFSNNAVISGATSGSGIVGESRNIDAENSTDTVNIPANNPVADAINSRACTLNFWINVDTFGPTNFTDMMAVDGDRTWRIEWVNADTINLYTDDGDSGNEALWDPPSNNWMMCTWTLNGTDSLSYENGVQTQTDTLETGTSDVDGALLIGGEEGIFRIDEVQVWDRVLSDAEIKRLYNKRT